MVMRRGLPESPPARVLPRRRGEHVQPDGEA